MPTVNIAFTGLCFFTKVGADVIVQLPDAARTDEYHSGFHLRVHAGAIFVPLDNLVDNPEVTPGPSRKVVFPLQGLNVTASGGAALDLPNALASVSKMTGISKGAAAPGRARARLTLKGGGFAGTPLKTSDPLSGLWDAGRPDPEDLRWQANWTGDVAHDITLYNGTESIDLTPNAAGVISLQIVNVMPQELTEWMNDDVFFHIKPGSSVLAEDFRWFYWMLDVAGGQRVPISISGPSGVRGFPYTCLLGGA